MVTPMSTPDDTPTVRLHIIRDKTNQAGTKRTIDLSATFAGQPVDYRLHLRASGNPELVRTVLDGMTETLPHAT
jgi:hypothetical protein